MQWLIVPLRDEDDDDLMSDVGTVELQPLNTGPSSSPSNPRLRWYEWIGV